MNSLTSSSEQSRLAEATTMSATGAGTIGALLQSAGKLKQGDIERVLKLQQQQKLRFGEAAKRLGLVTDADISQVLSQQFGYPFMAPAEAKLKPDLIVGIDPHGTEAEALRSVRSELTMRWFERGHKALAVGSTCEDDGASYLAANLAVLFAQVGHKVLLIDANLRQPRQHKLFNLGNGVGLSDILAERVPSLQVHTIKPFHTLSVLPAGSLPPNPAELLARPAFGELLSGLGTTYDVILIDTAPSQLASDFHFVSARAGGTLIASRRNVSRLAPLADLKEKIALSGAQVVGAVVLD